MGLKKIRKRKPGGGRKKNRFVNVPKAEDTVVMRIPKSKVEAVKKLIGKK